MPVATKPLTVRLAVLALTFGLAGCAGANAGDAPSAPTGSPDPAAPRVVARDIAFQPGTVTVRAGAATDLVFDNEDTAPHDIAVLASDGSVLFRGDVFGGAAQRVYRLPVLKAGTYRFVCDVHPNMVGTLVAR